MKNDKHIILFDGECNFCSFWVNYVIKMDKNDLFRFASLQSDIGRKFIRQFRISPLTDSVVLVEKGMVHIRSTAALRILKNLGGFPSAFFSLIIIPRVIRDFFYDLIARYRYRWFGKSDCEFVAPQGLKNKFLM